MSCTPPGKTREKVLRFVRERLLSGRSPTVREVQEAFGFRAVQSARQHLETLVAEGRLTKEPGRSRGYGLPGGADAVSPTRLVPLVGRVQAGALTLATEDPEGFVPIQSSSARGDLFALRVRGESMTGAGILPGDIAVVRRQQAAEPGQIVVARVGDEATVKTLRLRQGRVELHPENPDFSPIVPEPGDDVEILGKVIEIRRYLEGESILDGERRDGPR
jgi:repressor LexA